MEDDAENLYTVADRNGDSRRLFLTLSEAAEEILGHDGHEWRISPDPQGGHSLWTSPFSRNSTAYNGLRKSVVFSPETDLEAATWDIHRQVIAKSHEWGGLEGEPQAAYEANLERMIEDAAASGDTGLENLCRGYLADARGELGPRPVNAPGP